MAVQLTIPYDTLLELVKQLPVEQQSALVKQVLAEQSQVRSLTTDEKLALLDAAKLNNVINETPSVRREDWYGDDGR